MDETCGRSGCTGQRRRGVGSDDGWFADLDVADLDDGATGKRPPVGRRADLQQDVSREAARALPGRAGLVACRGPSTAPPSMWNLYRTDTHPPRGESPGKYVPVPSRPVALHRSRTSGACERGAFHVKRTAVSGRRRQCWLARAHPLFTSCGRAEAPFGMSSQSSAQFAHCVTMFHVKHRNSTPSS